MTQGLYQQPLTHTWVLTGYSPTTIGRPFAMHLSSPRGAWVYPSGLLFADVNFLYPKAATIHATQESPPRRIKASLDSP